MGLGLGLCCCEPGCCFGFVEGLTTTQSATITISGGTGEGANFNGTWLLPYLTTIANQDFFNYFITPTYSVSVAGACYPVAAPTLDAYTVTVGKTGVATASYRCGATFAGTGPPYTDNRCELVQILDALGVGPLSIDFLEFNQV